jgi:hypothetical protein
MSDSELPGIILTGMPVCTKEDEDYVVGVVESVEGKSGNLIIRGNLDCENIRFLSTLLLTWTRLATGLYLT